MKSQYMRLFGRNLTEQTLFAFDAACVGPAVVGTSLCGLIR